MKSSIIALALLLGLGVGVADAGTRCLSYEPAQVTLVGTLTSRALPGPPNYRSVAQGDHPETVFILTLDEPICVSGDPSSPSNSKSHSGVTEVQLVIRGTGHKPLLHKKVRASGSLFGAHTGHHRTPVVLSVVKMDAAEPITEGSDQ